MGNSPKSNTIVAYIEHMPAEGLVRADLRWPLLQPRDTYTIDIGDHVSLELDKTLPVRPASVTVHESGLLLVREQLLNAMGERLVEAVCEASYLGFQSIELELSAVNRREIALLQAHSPSTPFTIARSCLDMLNVMDRHDPAA